MQLLKRLKKCLSSFRQRLRAKKVRRRLPFRRSPLNLSWVIPGQLAVGGIPRVGDSAILDQANVKVVFSLCANSEETLPDDVVHNFRCVRLVLPDSHYRSEIKPPQLARAVDIIHQNLQNRYPVYVHCIAGIERSPTVCIAYLCRYHQLELWEAINWIKQVHPCSMPTESQVWAIRQFLNQSQSL